MKIGIDLGSSSTLAAMIGGEGQPVVIPDTSDSRQQVTPSKLTLLGGRALVGTFAERLGQFEPSAITIRNFKRHLGSGKVLATIAGDAIYSELAAAMLLRKVRHDAAMYSGGSVSGCVITVPAHFNDLQRKSVLEAAEIAGLDVSALLDEPIAAALAYVHSKALRDGEIAVIYDLGGGTFDLTLLTVNAGEIQILAKSGLTGLGGTDFDRILIDQFQRDYVNFQGGPCAADPLSEARLANFAEQMKVALGNDGNRWPVGEVYIDGKMLRWIPDALEYEREALNLVRRTDDLVVRTLRSAGLEFSDVDRMMLVGGASRAPIIRSYWEKRIDPNRQAIADDQPLVSVAKGAAIFASGFDKNGGARILSNYRLSSVTAYNVGVTEASSSRFHRIIEKNAPLPASGSVLIRIDDKPDKPFAAVVGQYLDDPDHVDPLGTIAVQPQNLLGRATIELILRNNEDGTLGVKVGDPASGAVVPFAYENRTHPGRDVHEQRRCFEKFRINAIEE